ncbi:MAG: FUSC family protein [Bacteroidetes bacterium]|nr:FUSC family protein [Bacteroidota bacterium]
MDYLKEYKSFINSHYLASGVRITAGVVLPAVILNYFGLLQAGIIVSLGAMCVSGVDNPGPIHHRRNGMMICTALIFLVSLITDFALPHDFWLGVFIFIACFVLSMIGIYGARATSIGVSALLIMVLNLSHQYKNTSEILWNALYVLLGGIWYTLLSLALYSIRPYKLAQQALGDCIMATAGYLRIRARFYEKNTDHEAIFKELLEQQIAVHQQQELLRELLFKTRSIVKESTDNSRTLVLVFIDLVDLFERIMASYYDYDKLHSFFDDSDILERYHQLILRLTEELDNIGLAVKEGHAARPYNPLSSQLAETRSYLENLRDKRRSPENIEMFISLRNILDSIEDLSARIHTMQLYTTKDRKLLRKKKPKLEYEKFVTPHEDVTFSLLKDNLSFNSNIFRHSLRVSVATLAGYIISKFLPLGHGYWILLTIVVILKPAYSLSKQRGYQRVLGTIGGAAIGLGILLLVKNNTALFIIMLVLMMGTYSFLRTQYLVSVLFMTPYIILLFHLLYQSKIETILTDRVIDTAIGSVIAFLANLFLVPVWEHGQITTYITRAIEANARYFGLVANAFAGQPANTHDFKLARKNAFVSLANLSDAFSRMLSEPKRKQKNSREVHQLVVLNHTFTSYTATLSSYIHPLADKHRSADFAAPMEATLAHLEASRAVLNKEPVKTPVQAVKPQLVLEQKLRDLMEKSREEIRHGELETVTRETVKEFKPIADLFNFTLRAAADIRKISIKLAGEI